MTCMSRWLDACLCVCLCVRAHALAGGVQLHTHQVIHPAWNHAITTDVWRLHTSTCMINWKNTSHNCNIKFGMCSGNSPLEVIALDCMFTTTNRLPACPQTLSEQQGPDLSALQQCGKLSWQYYKIEHITPLYCCVFLSYNSGHLFKCHHSHVCSLLLVVHWRKGLDEEAHMQYSLSSWPAIKEDQHTLQLQLSWHH